MEEYVFQERKPEDKLPEREPAATMCPLHGLPREIEYDDSEADCRERDES
ncbi:hypothetical protein [Mesorhizobium sp. KR2-14]